MITVGSHDPLHTRLHILAKFLHTEDLDLPLSLQLQNFTEFMDLVPWEQFSLHYFHKLQIIGSIH